MHPLLVSRQVAVGLGDTGSCHSPNPGCFAGLPGPSILSHDHAPTNDIAKMNAPTRTSFFMDDLTSYLEVGRIRSCPSGSDPRGTDSGCCEFPCPCSNTPLQLQTEVQSQGRPPPVTFSLVVLPDIEGFIAGITHYPAFCHHLPRRRSVLQACTSPAPACSRYHHYRCATCGLSVLPQCSGLPTISPAGSPFHITVRGVDRIRTCTSGVPTDPSQSPV